MYDLPPIRPAPLLLSMAAFMVLMPASLAAQNVTSAPIAPNDPMISTQWRLKPSTPTLETQELGEPAIDTHRIQAPTMPLAADKATAPIGTEPPRAAPAPDAAAPAPAPIAAPAPVATWRPNPAPQVAPVPAPPAATAAPVPAPVRTEPPLTVFIRNPENTGADILPILGIAAIAALAIAVGALAFSINRRGKRERLEAMQDADEAVFERVAEPASPPEATHPITPEPEPAPSPAPPSTVTAAEPRMASISTKITGRQVPVWTISIPTRPTPPPQRRAVRAVIQS